MTGTLKQSFGEYVSVYDIQQAVEDGATVPIYYESRLAKINLDQSVLPTVDEEVETILDDETADEREKEKAKSQWSASRGDCRYRCPSSRGRRRPNLPTTRNATKPN